MLPVHRVRPFTIESVVHLHSIIKLIAVNDFGTKELIDFRRFLTRTVIIRFRFCGSPPYSTSSLELLERLKSKN